MDDIPRNRTYRLLEMVPALVSLGIIFVPFIGAFWFPRGATIFIAVYVVAWFLRAMKSNVFLIHSFKKSRRFEKLHWDHLLSFFSDTPPTSAPRTEMEKQTVTQIAHLKSCGKFKKWEEIYHVIIMPTYKEELDILEPSLEQLSTVQFPKERIIFVLATEERDALRAGANADYLESKFKSQFGQFYHIMHPAHIPGEIPAKGANITYSCKKIVEILKKQNIDPSNVLVTTLDADNRPHQTYLEVLTYHYLMEEHRNRRTYQPLAFFYNNIWDVPFANRIIALGNTFWFLSESGEAHHLFNSSSYGQSLDMLIEMDFWSRQTIVEDLHQFWRAYFYFKGDHDVIPLFIPVYQDALQNRTYFTSLVGQYKQLRRWAWGASDVPYVIMKYVKHCRELPFFKTLMRFLYLVFSQTLWATGPIIIILNTSITTILNPAFANSVFIYNFGSVLNIIFKITLVGIGISFWISLISLPRPKGRFGKLHFVSLFLQLMLVPLVTILYGSISALDAQIRLMINKPLGFTVTEKIRKTGGTT